MIRVGIFVYQQGNVSIDAPFDQGALLRRYNSSSSPVANGTHALDSGIYLVLADGEIKVQGEHVDVVILHEEKDPLPVPKARQLALEPGATADQLVQFFTVAKGADAPDESSTESG